MPYYHLVPKDIRANLKWRLEVIDFAEEDEGEAVNLRTMCAAGRPARVDH